MAKLVNLEIFNRRLKGGGFWIFTSLDVRRVFGVSKVAATFLLHRYAKRGLITRLKVGLYRFSDATLPEFYIANRLYSPSYISLDAALSFYGIIPETVYSITSVTPKGTREFTTGGIRYSYQKIKKGAFEGYRATSYQGKTILIAEQEKALADYLYFIDLKKREFSYERINLKKINRTKLHAYIELFHRPGLEALVKKIYAEYRKPKRIH